MKFNYYKIILICLISLMILFLLGRIFYIGAGMYFVALVGVIKNKKWGSILIVILSLTLIPSSLKGFIIIDFPQFFISVLMLFPAYKLIMQLSTCETRQYWESMIRTSCNSIKNIPKEIIKNKNVFLILLIGFTIIIVFCKIFGAVLGSIITLIILGILEWIGDKFEK